MLKSWWPSCSHGDGNVVKGESERSLLCGQNWKAKLRESVCEREKEGEGGGGGEGEIKGENHHMGELVVPEHPCSQASPPESQQVQREDPPKARPGGLNGLILQKLWQLPAQAEIRGRHRAPATSTDGFSSPLLEVCKCSALLINTVSISRL